MMYLFGGQAGRQRLFCGRVISLVYRVNVLFITDVIYIREGPEGLSTSGEMICQMDGTETSDAFSLFLY